MTTTTTSPGSPHPDIDITQKISVVMFGLNYRFGYGGPVARY